MPFSMAQSPRPLNDPIAIQNMGAEQPPTPLRRSAQHGRVNQSPTESIWCHVWGPMIPSIVSPLAR